MRQECRERFPHYWPQRKQLVSDPSMHHGTCITHVPRCMLDSLSHGGRETFQAFPAHAQPVILLIWQEAHDAETSSNFSHKLHWRSVTMNTSSKNIKPYKKQYSELPKCSTTPPHVNRTSTYVCHKFHPCIQLHMCSSLNHRSNSRNNWRYFCRIPNNIDPLQPKCMHIHIIT